VRFRVKPANEECHYLDISHLGAYKDAHYQTISNCYLSSQMKVTWRSRTLFGPASNDLSLSTNGEYLNSDLNPISRQDQFQTLPLFYVPNLHSSYTLVNQLPPQTPTYYLAPEDGCQWSDAIYCSAKLEIRLTLLWPVGPGH